MSLDDWYARKNLKALYGRENPGPHAECKGCGAPFSMHRNEGLTCPSRAEKKAALDAADVPF